MPATATSTPQPPTATSAKSARRSGARGWSGQTCSWRPRSGSATTATKRPCAVSRRAPGSSALRDRPPGPSPTAPLSVRADPGGLPCSRDPPRRGKGPRPRGQQSRGRAPHDAPDRASVVPAINQIDCHPYFAQREVQELGAVHGIATQSVVADRRHHLLSRRQPRQHPRRSCHQADRRQPSQVCRPGDASLGTAARALCHSPSPPNPAASRRTSTCSTSSSPARRSTRSTASTPAVALAPN